MEHLEFNKFPEIENKKSDKFEYSDDEDNLDISKFHNKIKSSPLDNDVIDEYYFWKIESYNENEFLEKFGNKRKILNQKITILLYLGFLVLKIGQFLL